jgi:hypothetical protein
MPLLLANQQETGPGSAQALVSILLHIEILAYMRFWKGTCRENAT